MLKIDVGGNWILSCFDIYSTFCCLSKILGHLLLNLWFFWEFSPQKWWGCRSFSIGWQALAGICALSSVSPRCFMVCGNGLVVDLRAMEFFSWGLKFGKWMAHLAWFLQFFLFSLFFFLNSETSGGKFEIFSGRLVWDLSLKNDLFLCWEVWMCVLFVEGGGWGWIPRFGLDYVLKFSHS